jgi:hypothetical protein
MRLHRAVLARVAPDRRAALVEAFMLLDRPGGDWDDYQADCRRWVHRLLQDETRYETELIREPVHQALQYLPERLRKPLWLRFGFDGQAPRTLEQVGHELGLSKERIRQLEAGALHRLRHWSGRDGLKRLRPGVRLRSKLFAEIRRCSGAPALFAMWHEDFEALRTLTKAHESAVSRRKEAVPRQRRAVQSDAKDRRLWLPGLRPQSGIAEATPIEMNRGGHEHEQRSTGPVDSAENEGLPRPASTAAPTD